MYLFSVLDRSVESAMVRLERGRSQAEAMTVMARSIASVLALMVITVLSYTVLVVRKTNIRLVYPA